MTTYNIPPASRYYGIEVASLETADGRVVRYLRRRLLPPSDGFALLRTHVVSDGERMDHVAAQELGDPEAFWRICDANDALRPEDLVSLVGRRLRITLPQGIPGPAAE